MRTDNTFLKVILFLAIVGAVTSGWLLNTHIKFATGQASLTESCGLPGVGGGQGCANVAVSDYSDVLGVPVAAIGLGYYLTLLLLVFWAMRNYQMAYEPLYVAFFLSTLAIVVTVVMFVISRFILKQFCIGCSLLWVVNLLVWPSFVKHLKLSWHGAVAENLELVRSRRLQLQGGRIKGSFIAGGIVLLVACVAGAAAKGQGRAESNVDSSSIVAEFQAAPHMVLPGEAYGGPQAKGLVDGSRTPVLDIVEFADFQCPGCRMAAQLLRPFVMKHGDKVRITYRNFPLDGSCNPLVPNGQHNLACTAARASICAGKQGKFWEMHDRIFDGQDSLTAAGIEQFASVIGLDAGQYQACLKDAGTEQQLQKEIQWGDVIQLQSTPTLIMNGRRLSGARSPQDLEALLKHLEAQGAGAR